MLVVGLTGQIAGGKSTIARVLRQRGYVVYDTDAIARSIIANDASVQQKIIALLGNESFINGEYQKTYVAKKIFRNNPLRLSLNAIVHPAVKTTVETMLHKVSDFQSVVFIESALLFEGHLDVLCDKIIEIRAPMFVRYKRLRHRDKDGFFMTLQKIFSQYNNLPVQNKSNIIIINNDGNRSIDAVAQELLDIINL